MIKNFSRLFFLFITLSCFLVGCGMGTLSAQPRPTTLQVTRVSRSDSSQRFWTITDVKRVQQLFQEIQQLPSHQNNYPNNEADSCVNDPYDYSLNFFVGTKSIQQDDLGWYCGTLTLVNGRHFNPTETFNSLFRNMLSVNDLWATISVPFAQDNGTIFASRMLGFTSKEPQNSILHR